MKLSFNRLLVTVFILVSLFQLSLQFFDIEIYENNAEYRNKPKFPKLKWEWSYIKEFEDFYQNNFKLRNILIHTNAVVRYTLFHISSSEKVFIGENNWLFYEDDKANSTYRNATPYTPEELEAKFQFHEQRAKLLKEKKIPYIFFVGPNKQSIYPEFLPDWATKKISPISRYDQLIEKMKTSKNILVVDSKRILQNLKSTYQLYYNTDSHWNVYAAYHIYNAVMTSLYEETKNRNYLPTPIDDFHLSPTDESFPGDLLRMMNLAGWIKEKGNFTYKRPQFPKPELSYSIFRDSFYISLRIFFEFQYKLESDLHWAEEKNANWDEIAKKSDFVIFEQVERNL